MPGTQDLIRTILQLQQVRASMDAAQLAREQFGLEQQRSRLAGLAGVQGMLPGMSNPSAFVQQNVGELSDITGASPDALTSIAGQTPPSAATQRAGAAAAGAAGSTNPLDLASAYNVYGSPASATEDQLLHDIFMGSRSELAKKTPDEKAQFFQQALSRTGQGMSLGAAALDQAVADLPPELRSQAAKIGKGLAPSASEDIQTRLGYAQLRNQSHYQQTSLALDELRIRAELDSHRQQFSAQAFKEVDDLVQARAKFLVDAARTGQTLTPDGLETYRNQVNAYNARLRELAPGVFGKGAPGELPDIPKGSGLTVPGLGQQLDPTEFFKNVLPQP